MLGIFDLTCTQVLMHAIAHEGCTDTRRESGLKVDSGRKIPCCPGESDLPQRHASLTLSQTEPHPRQTVLPAVCVTWLQTTGPVVKNPSLFYRLQ